MRNQLVTPFWKNALASLPVQLRARYVHHIEHAERWELRWNAMIQLWSRVKTAFTRTGQTPRSAH
jgi:hypothetical protein